MRATLLLVLTLTTVAGCSRGDDGRMGFRDIGPEQSNFTVTPADPLEIPPVLSLPAPNPGGTNRAER